VSGIFKKLEISFGNSSRAVCMHEEPPTKISGFDLHICHAISFYTGILPKIQRIFGDKTVFRITFDNMLELVSFSLRIAT
jgi:hypothetical protein